MTEPAVLRPYAPSDLPALYDVCVRTGFNGEDARPHYPDPDLLADIYVAPYAALEPELTFVIDNGQRAVGYILGAADTTDFVRRYRTEWLPTIAARRPPLSGAPTTATDYLVDLLHHPERMIRPELADYPAHLHIDLLASHQRAGHGRSLMRGLCDALAARGVPAVHLGVGSANTAAQAFYTRLGFHPIPIPDLDGVRYLGRDTAWD